VSHGEREQGDGGMKAEKEIVFRVGCVAVCSEEVGGLFE